MIDLIFEVIVPLVVMILIIYQIYEESKFYSESSCKPHNENKIVTKEKDNE